MKISGVLAAVAAAMMVSASSMALAAEKPATKDVGLPQAALESNTTITVSGRPLTGLWGKINPFAKDIQVYWGKINPFYGDINSYWGKINPFGTDVTAFWGKINPFAGDITGQWGKIGAFWGTIGAFWGDIYGSWGKIGAFDLTQYTSLSLKLKNMAAQSEAFWGATIRAQTGKTFTTVFLNPLLAKYGINFNDPASLAKLDPARRSQFMLDWYDGLMAYSGMDRVDHWMATANWTPALTQQQGGGAGVKIGLLDFFVSSSLFSNIVSFNGTSTFSNGHGAAVASLMVSAHDRKGVMGVAPNATVVGYNPFDATSTASWEDVRKGVHALSASGASVINMSLGVPGSTFDTGWKAVFSDPAIASVNRNTIFVIAAGNDGKTQTTAVPWDYATDPNLIIVGSVDPTGQISSFSNTPGTVCLTKNNACQPGRELMDRFMVAPGELILVSDGRGSVMRASGTSFAAPLVTGAIALLHDRWPWLRQFPAETIDIMFRSAKDLGAKGIDPVYGNGLLDITASQSPLDFSRLTYYEYAGSTPVLITATAVRSGGIKPTWEAAGAYFTAFEKIGKAQRDFAIPLSSRLTNQSLLMQSGLESYQQFLYARLTNWIKTGNTRGTGFASLGYSTPDTVTPNGWNVTFTMVERPEGDYIRDLDADYAMRFTSGDGAMALTAGYGLGSAAMGFMPGFDHVADYAVTSGVNPYLSLASGGGFASFDVRIADDLMLSTGITSQSLDLRIHDEALGRERRLMEGLAAYEATAFNATLTYTPTDAIRLTAAVTRLHEDSGLLGMQWADAGRDNGAVTNVLTLGGSLDLGDDYRAAVSASIAATEAGSGPANLALGEDARSSAFQLTVSKDRLLTATDALRVSVSQPLAVEDGRIEYTSVEVIDRMTGEIGPVTRSFDIGGRAEYVAEVSYGTAILGGNGELSLFARSEVGPQSRDDETPDQSGGLAFRLRF